MGSVLPALRVRKGASEVENPAVALRELAQASAGEITPQGYLDDSHSGLRSAADVGVASRCSDQPRSLERVPVHQTFTGAALGGAAHASTR